jgi:transcriptional regulator with XRE-family HTH domain
MTAFQDFMNSRQISQYRLHKLSGFIKTSISEWQSGKHRPSLASARRLAITLRIPIEDLLRQIEVRERVQNARTPQGEFVPKTKKNRPTIGDTNDSGRTGPAYWLTCRRMMAKVA